MSGELEFERLIDAQPELVFDAFTSPEGQREFYGKDSPEPQRFEPVSATAYADGSISQVLRP